MNISQIAIEQESRAENRWRGFCAIFAPTSRADVAQSFGVADG